MLTLRTLKDQEEQRRREDQNRLAVAESHNPNETFLRQIGSWQASNDLPRGMAIIYQPSLFFSKEVLLTFAGRRYLAEAASVLTNSREKSDAGAECIHDLNDFLAQLDKLLSFFSGLCRFLEDILEGPTKEFLAQVNNIVTIDNALAGGDQEKSQARMEMESLKLVSEGKENELLVNPDLMT